MLPLGVLALLGGLGGAGLGALKGGGKGALLGGALGAGAGYGIPAAMGMGASATPALSPGLMEMAGAPTAAGVTSITPAGLAVAGGADKGIMPYLGLGASAISPVAGAMLGRQPQEYPSATPTNVGAKPPWQLDNFYPPPRQRMPTSLARLLMGIR